MIAVLLDQGTPRSAAALLRERGWDATHTSEIGASRAEDAEILQIARAATRVVVTLDADFYALLALSSATTPSVIRIRIEGLRAEAFAGLLMTVITQCQDALQAGAIVTVQPQRMRIRALPLI
jgi:predicted nuclease of predicted toxin-antitoxin system